MGEKNLALITMNGQRIVDGRQQSKNNGKFPCLQGGRQFWIQFLTMVFPPCRRIKQAEKFVDCVNQIFWSVSDTTYRPKFYFRIFKAHNLNNFLGRIGVEFEVGLEVG